MATKAMQWDQQGQKTYETGVDHVGLYLMDDTGKFSKGVPWNGVTKITESPDGAEEQPQYADNGKYLSLYSSETFKATIEALTYPDEFAQCDGTVEATPGVFLGQQNRTKFALAYRTRKGNDTKGDDYGYKLNLIYNAMAAPSQKEHDTVNDSPSPISFSWDLSTTPLTVEGYKPTSFISIDSTKVNADKLAAFLKILNGDETTDPRMPDPSELITLLTATPSTPSPSTETFSMPEMSTPNLGN